MSRTHIPLGDRRQVGERAGGRCEYCLVHEADVDLRHEVDHIIAEKHGGATHLDNLAYACFVCNKSKGSDIASLSYGGAISRFFNPRTDIWAEHFRIEGDRIVPITSEAEATDRIFFLNKEERRIARRDLQASGRYPLQNEATSSSKRSTS